MPIKIVLSWKPTWSTSNSITAADLGTTDSMTIMFSLMSKQILLRRERLDSRFTSRLSTKKLLDVITAMATRSNQLCWCGISMGDLLELVSMRKYFGAGLAAPWIIVTQRWVWRCFAICGADICRHGMINWWWFALPFVGDEDGVEDDEMEPGNNLACACSVTDPTKASN